MLNKQWFINEFSRRVNFPAFSRKVRDEKKAIRKMETFLANINYLACLYELLSWRDSYRESKGGYKGTRVKIKMKKSINPR